MMHTPGREPEPTCIITWERTYLDADMWSKKGGDGEAARTLSPHNPHTSKTVAHFKSTDQHCKNSFKNQALSMHLLYVHVEKMPEKLFFNGVSP